MRMKPYKPEEDQKKNRNAPETQAVPLQHDYWLCQQSDHTDSPSFVRSHGSHTFRDAVFTSHLSPSVIHILPSYPVNIEAHH